MSRAVEPLGIVELVSVCDHEVEWHRAWARSLGAAVATSTPGDVQRWRAEASQRHVDLAARWARRRPEIPEPSAPTGTSSSHAADDVADGVAAYRDDLANAQQRYRALIHRVDSDLDHNTSRTLRHCQREIDDLLDTAQRRLAAGQSSLW